MATARDQAEEGRLEHVLPIGHEEIGRHVALQMVDRGERQATGRRQSLGVRETDQQCSDQAWALRRGYQLHLAPASCLPLPSAARRRGRSAPGGGARRSRHTPPKRSWACWEEITFERIVPVGSAMTAAQVSSSWSRSRGSSAPSSYRPGFGTSSNEPASVAGVRHITKRPRRCPGSSAGAGRGTETFAFLEMNRMSLERRTSSVKRALSSCTRSYSSPSRAEATPLCWCSTSTATFMTCHTVS